MKKRWTKQDLENLKHKGVSIIHQSGQKSIFDDQVDYSDIYSLLVHYLKINKAVFLPGNIPSSKNSREILQVPTKQSICCNAGLIKQSSGALICAQCSKTTKRKYFPKLGYSKTVDAYIRHTHSLWLDKRALFYELFPKTSITCGLYFVRDSARRYDYHNATQIIGDLMTQYGYITDDNTDNIKFIPLGTHVKKEHSGVIFVNLPSFDKVLLTTLKLV